MSDIKLFRITDGKAAELTGKAVPLERGLQTLFEANLEALLGVRFLASEHSTGTVHGGRIDTLGIDEDGTQVIVEYKRTVDENVINQGLYYLDWLMDHKKEFQWLTMERLGENAAKSVDWSGPRLLCIARDFTRYDEHAVRQIPRKIELLRYRRFNNDLLLIELVHAPKSVRPVRSPTNFSDLPINPPEVSEMTPDSSSQDPYLSQRMAYRLANAPAELRNLYEALHSLLASLGDDVQVKELKNYVAFKRIKNFACVEIVPQARLVVAYLRLDPDTAPVEPGFTRDMRKTGHFGTGDLEVSMRTMDDLAKADALFKRAYEGG